MNIDKLSRDINKAFYTGLLNYKQFIDLLNLTSKAAAGNKWAAVLLKIKGRAIYV